MSPRTMRHRVLGACLAVLATTFLAAPAFAEDLPSVPSGPVPGGFGSWRDLIAVQRQLNDTAERILAVADDGLAGVVAAPENRKLLVHWKGTVPTRVRALASRSPGQVPVRILPAAFSAKELRAAANLLVRRPGVRSVTPEADGSGLRVGVTDATTSIAATTADVPLRIETGITPTRLIDRQNDRPPFWGGARYLVGGGRCSTGFGVVVAGTPAILTAGHCGNDGQTAVAGGTPGGPMGVLFGDDTGRDTILINTSSGARIYTGPFNSDTNVGVRGARPSFVGNWVCTSGASSGEHCGVQVKAVDTSFVERGQVHYPMVYAEHWARLCAAAPGDSGGPVHAYHGDGRTDAKGTITAGITDTQCPGSAPIGAWRIWYADTAAAIDYYRSRYGTAEILTS